jgi:hypothetical protein
MPPRCMLEQAFLASALDEVSGHFQTPAALLPEKGAWYSLGRGLCEPRADLDAVEKRQMLCS